MKKSIAVVTSLILASGMAFAGEGAKESSFTDLDKDGNGAITQSEASNHDALMANFTAADVNRDGQLSRTEFDAVQPELEEAE